MTPAERAIIDAAVKWASALDDDQFTEDALLFAAQAYQAADSREAPDTAHEQRGEGHP